MIPTLSHLKNLEPSMFTEEGCWHLEIDYKPAFIKSGIPELLNILISKDRESIFGAISRHQPQRNDALCHTLYLFGISLLGMDSQRRLDLDCFQTLSKRPPRLHNDAWAASRPIEQAGSQSDNQTTPRQDHQTQSANRETIKPNRPIGHSGT